MNKALKSLLLLFSLVLVSGLAGSAFAQKAAKTKTSKKAAPVAAKFLGMGDGIESCAVTGEKLENKNIKGEFFGREVYFCCEGCLDKARKSPALYVKKTEAEQIAAVKGIAAKPHEHGDHHAKETKTETADAKFLGKGDGIETCPVTGEPISKDVKFEVQGKTVYACCPGCIEKVKAHPELYLKWAAKQ